MGSWTSAQTPWVVQRTAGNCTDSPSVPPRTHLEGKVIEAKTGMDKRQPTND